MCAPTLDKISSRSWCPSCGLTDDKVARASAAPPPLVQKQTMGTLLLHGWVPRDADGERREEPVGPRHPRTNGNATPKKPGLYKSCKHARTHTNAREDTCPCKHRTPTGTQGSTPARPTRRRTDAANEGLSQHTTPANGLRGATPPSAPKQRTRTNNGGQEPARRVSPNFWGLA